MIYDDICVSLSVCLHVYVHVILALSLLVCKKELFFFVFSFVVQQKMSCHIKQDLSNSFNFA